MAWPWFDHKAVHDAQNNGLISILSSPNVIRVNINCWRVFCSTQTQNFHQKDIFL